MPATAKLPRVLDHSLDELKHRSESLFTREIWRGPGPGIPHRHGTQTNASSPVSRLHLNVNIHHNGVRYDSATKFDWRAVGDALLGPGYVLD